MNAALPSPKLLTIPTVLAARDTLKTNNKNKASTTTVRKFAIANIAISTLSLLSGIALIAFGLMSLFDLATFLTMYVLTGLGVSVGFHRLSSHRAFRTGRGLETGLLILGSMAAQGPIMYWVAIHRLHHANPDSEKDPHSPHFRPGRSGFCVGNLLHAHVGWQLNIETNNSRRLPKDLASRSHVRFVNRSYLFWVLAGILAPGIFSYLLNGTVSAFLSSAFWGGLFRIAVLQHSTWSINSICHILGSRPFESRDHSRNNLPLALLTLGEGWHNNHHASPASAYFNRRWWQLDLGGLLIRALESANLIWDTRKPPPSTLDASPVARH